MLRAKLKDFTYIQEEEVKEIGVCKVQRTQSLVDKVDEFVWRLWPHTRMRGSVGASRVAGSQGGHLPFLPQRGKSPFGFLGFVRGFVRGFAISF